MGCALQILVPFWQWCSAVPALGSASAAQLSAQSVGGEVTVAQEDASVSSELRDCIHRTRDALGNHVRLLDRIIAILVQHESAVGVRSDGRPVPAVMTSVLAPMLQAEGSSSGTLITLSGAPGLRTRDCYTVARSIVEIAINACFIMAEGPTEAERAMRHARQKSHRDLERESVVAGSVIGLSYSGTPDPGSLEGLRDEIEEFTSKTGREKGWTDLSVDDRMARVGARFGDSVLTPLHWARFAVYRHSSEILHGTLFGALYFFGLTSPKPPSSLEEFAESLGQQHMMVLLACVLAISATVKSFNAAYGFQKVSDDSDRILKELRQVRYLYRQP